MACWIMTDHGMVQLQSSDLPTVPTTALPVFSGDSGTGGIAGAIPPPAAGDGAAGKFLRADGIWALPPTGSPGGVTSVAGRTGVVVLGEGDIANLVTDLAAKAPLASPGLTGIPTAPTAAGADNSTQIATTAFVKGQGYITAAPVASVAGKTGIVTLAEGDITNLVSDLAAKAPLASPGLTGVPTAPTAAAGTNTTQIATTAFAKAMDNNAAYSVILSVAGSHTAAKVAGTYALGFGDPVAVSGTGTLYPIGIINIVGADYPTINGVTTKLRIRAQLFTNDVAPTGNFTFGLYPITRPATSGGAGLCIFTLGTVVAGSNGATFTTPAADLAGVAVGADFAIPADGLYCIGVVTTGTIATSAHVHMVAQLQLRNG